MLVPASRDVVVVCDEWLERVVARLCYRCGVLLECQLPVQDDAKHFHLLRHWQIDPDDSQTGRLVALVVAEMTSRRS